MVAETHVKKVAYCVCKPVHYTKTIQVANAAARSRSAYTVTRCVPRCVCKQVPVTVCCPVPCCCASVAAAATSEREGASRSFRVLKEGLV